MSLLKQFMKSDVVDEKAMSVIHAVVSVHDSMADVHGRRFDPFWCYCQVARHNLLKLMPGAHNAGCDFDEVN